MRDLESRLAFAMCKPWNISVSVCDSTVEKRRALLRFDSRIPRARVDRNVYKSPRTRSASVNDATRKDKTEFNEVRDQLSREVLFMYPDICPENLEAKAFRMFRARKYGVDKPLHSDDATTSPPLSRSSSPSKHSQNRRWYHTGVFGSGSNAVWTCCMSAEPESKGCAFSQSDSRSWCVLP